MKGKRHTTTVEEHATGAGILVLVDALLLDGLLGGDVADCEQYGGGDALRQKRARRELALVPAAPG